MDPTRNVACTRINPAIAHSRSHTYIIFRVHNFITCYFLLSSPPISRALSSSFFISLSVFKPRERKTQKSLCYYPHVMSRLHNIPFPQLIPTLVSPTKVHAVTSINTLLSVNVASITHSTSTIIPSSAHQ